MDADLAAIAGELKQNNLLLGTLSTNVAVMNNRLDGIEKQMIKMNGAVAANTTRTIEHDKLLAVYKAEDVLKDKDAERERAKLEATSSRLWLYMKDNVLSIITLIILILSITGLLP